MVTITTNNLKLITMKASEIIVGRFFYHTNEYGKFLRKITWVGETHFEWNGGWSSIDSLTQNDNKKSNVKFILNN